MRRLSPFLLLACLASSAAAEDAPVSRDTPIIAPAPATEECFKAPTSRCLFADALASSNLGPAAAAHIGAMLADAGERDTARIILRQSASQASAGDENWQAGLSTIAGLQTKAGFVEDAMETIEMMERPPTTDPDYALEDTAKALANQGDFDRALGIVATMTNQKARIRALRRIAWEQCRKGDEASASRTVQQAGFAFLENMSRCSFIETYFAPVEPQESIDENAFDQVETFDFKTALERGNYDLPEFRDFVAAQVSEGGVDPRLIEKVATIDDSYVRDAVLLVMATGQALGGDTAGALATASMIKGTLLYSHPTLPLEEGFMYEGDVDGITDDDPPHVWVLARIVDALASRGDTAKAHEIAATIDVPWVRKEALYKVAVAQAAARDFAEAIASVREMPQDGLRAVATATIARNLAWAEKLGGYYKPVEQ